MDFGPENRKALGRWILGLVSACILIFLAVQNLGTLLKIAGWLLGLISPLILGFAFALIFNVPMRFLEDRVWPLWGKRLSGKLRRPICFLLSVLFIFGMFTGIILLVIPELLSAFKIIADGIVRFVNTISAMSIEEIQALPFGHALLSIDWDGMLQSLQSWLKNSSGSIVNTAFGTLSSLFGGIFDFVISFVFSIYIIFSKDTLKRQFSRLIRAWLPEDFGAWLIHACSVASVNLRNFISGQSLEAVILGLLCLLGMLLLRLPYAPMVGALVGITALIPVVGSFIGAGVGAFMILTVDPLKALIFLVFLIILQQIEGNLIYPKVMGSRVNLPGLWILAAVTVGGGIAGPVGMLLGVPLASSAYVLLREATVARELRLHPEFADNNPAPTRETALDGSSGCSCTEGDAP